MSKYVQLASQYYTDKDLYDLFAAKELPKIQLLKIASRKGFVLSVNDDVEEIRKYLCAKPFSFSEINAIISGLQVSDNAPKEKTRQIIGEIERDKLRKSIEDTFKSRLAQDESIVIDAHSEGALTVTVNYVELNLKSATPFQRLEKTVVVEIDDTDGALNIRYSGNERASEIVRELVRKLPYKDQDTSTQRLISLRDVRDSPTRINFFFDIVHGVEGFALLDLKELHMEHRFPDDEENADDDVEDVGDSQNDDDASAKSEQIKGLLKKAALSGKSVHTTDFYEQLESSGYYIASIVWTAQELKGDRRVVEFYCAFEDPVWATEFNFAVRRVLKAEGNSNGKGKKSVPPDLPKIKKALERAAYSAYEKIEKLKEVSQTESFDDETTVA